jgi:hypothetical protein
VEFQKFSKIPENTEAYYSNSFPAGQYEAEPSFLNEAAGTDPDIPGRSYNFGNKKSDEHIIAFLLITCPNPSLPKRIRNQIVAGVY